MAGRRKEKDRTSIIISVVLHGILIGALAYWAYKTGLVQQAYEKILKVVTADKKQAEQPPPQQKVQQPPPKLPPISTGSEQKQSSGTRRAVAADAPQAAGDTFFQDTRKQVTGPSASGTGTEQRKTETKIIVPPPPRPAPAMKAAATTSIKQLMEERAKASAVVESYGTEQISKSGVSDVGEIVSRISGATVAEGKFAVVRGLADRYTMSTLNGVDIPSADPDRRAAQLDLFPAQFLNRVDVNKTFQPDLPGGFAGGAINIVTRSFPEKPIFSFSVGTSYNTQSSLKDDFLFTDQGSHDWLAIDDGTREKPDKAAATDPEGTIRPVDPLIKDTFKSRQFAPMAGDSPVNSSLAVAFGDTTHFLGRPLGFLVGINHKIDYNHYNNGLAANKFNPIAGGFEEDYVDVRSTIEYMWGSLATLAYQISDNHELNFNFMFVQTAEDEARRLRGQSASFGSQPGISYVEKNILHWTERNLNNFQLRGGHLFPELGDTKLDWVGSLASTSQEEPDHRIIQFLAQPDNPNDPFDSPSFDPSGPAEPPNPSRIWRELQEDNTSFRMDLTIPLSPNGWAENSLKAGIFYSGSEQTYDSRAWEIQVLGSHSFRTNGNPDSIPDPDFYDQINYKNFPANFQYTGEQTIQAGYAMGTWSPLNWVRLVGGVRYETTELTVNTVNITQGGDPSSSAIDQKDLLPAVVGSFLLRSNLQFRAAWSQTIIRPTYREISEAEVYDVARGRTIRGNPDLTLSASENYDARLEWFPRAGEIISIGGFMKKMELPIELSQEDTTGDLLFYDNYEKADVYGFEVELRKNFRGFWGAPYDQFSLGFNYAYIKSEVPRTQEQIDNQERLIGSTSRLRPLYDQPEYVLNADLTWDSFISGTSVTLSGGVVGRRLVLVGYATPDEFEEPAPQLEFSISQKIGRHWKVRFSGKNLLDPVYEVTQDWDEEGIKVMERYTKGMQFGLSIGADF